MKNPYLLQKILLVLIVSILWNCNKEDIFDLHSENPFGDTINSYIISLPEWEIQDITPEPDRIIDSLVITNGTDEDTTYTCSVIESNLVQTIKEFFSVGTNFGIIWPGALIQGNSLVLGELKPIGVKRSPITLTTNLPLEESSVSITEPNSVTVQQAISDFMIAAGNMPEGSKAGAGFMNFQIEEASSFEQSMTAMGISAGFTEPQSSVGLNASLAVELNRSSRTHTVVAKFIQEMFTIRLADDLLPEPSDFFANDVSVEDIEELEKNGEIGNENIPLYIESVTYGRLMLFSMESKNVESASKLASALEVSMADYVNAEVNNSNEYKEIFAEKTSKYYSAGGTSAAANEAIALRDWSKFFVESPASTAVPISFVARTLSGKKIVGLVENVFYQHRNNCSLDEIIGPGERVEDYYSITVKWTATNGTGACIVPLACTEQASVKVGGEVAGTLLTVANSWTRNFIVDVEKGPYNFSINTWWSYSDTDNRTYNTMTYSAGTTKLPPHVLTNFAGSVTMDFTINKEIHYK